MGQEVQHDSDDLSSNLQSEDEVAVQSEQKKKKYKCTYPDCNAVFLRPSRLQRHVRLHTGEKPYKCQHEGCTKSYTNSSHLKRHFETHSYVRKTYKCTICSLTLSNLHNLRRHAKRVHTKNITCDKCSKTFNKKYQLVKHQAKNHNNTHKCDKCQKICINNSRLREHLKSHEIRYVCPELECSEAFTNWLLLRAHKKANHQIEHKCNICCKTFHSDVTLKNHSKIHEDRTYLLCPYDNCQRVYYFKSNLTNHVNTAHLGKKYVCDICSAKLVSKQAVRIHIQSLHQKKEKRPRVVKKNDQRKKRKDIGIPKKSALSLLVGLKLPNDLEKLVMTREETITINKEEYDVNLTKSN